MPAKTTIFNTRAVAKHTFPLGPRNTIIFSPQGRFVVVAGFGNLAGQMDIYDLEKDYKKVATVEASNASVCEWSPDGKHILTATTSPRLRVDNGVRIWHVSGGLMYNEDMNELYEVCWKPQPTVNQTIGDPFHQVPSPHPSALAYLATRKVPSKPAGAYRPPGARGQSTPLAFKREDEGGAAVVREGSAGNGGATNGFGKAKKRVVPGAESTPEYLPPGAAPGGGVALPSGAEGDEKLSKAAAKNKKKREAKKVKEQTDKGNSLAVDGNTVSIPTGPAADRRQGHSRSRSRGNQNLDPNSRNKQPRDRSRSNHQRQRSENNNQQRPNGAPPTGPSKANRANNNARGTANGASPVAAPGVTVTSPANSGINSTPQDKKIRGLLKKMRAIDELKMREAGGEKLEDTQLKKIRTEDEVRKDLEVLGWQG